MNAESRNSIDYSARGAVADVAATFAGIVLIVTSLMEILQGLAAIADPEFFVSGSDYLFRFDATVWGWWHLVLGVVTIVIAVGILLRKGWGQITGIIVAVIAMVTNFAYLPHYPLWAITVIAINLAIIWALSVQMKQYR